MARTRQIKPSFFINEDIVELPFHTRLLFIGLWTIADRRGVLDDRPKKIKMALFPADNIDVEECLNELESFNFIKRYEVDGMKCIHITEFVKHQHCHKDEKPNNMPSPPCVLEQSTAVNDTDFDQDEESNNDEKEQAPLEHDASTVQAPLEHDANTPSSLYLVANSFNCTVLSARDSFPEVPIDATQWASYFVNVHGFQIHEAQTASSIPMFVEWVKRKITLTDVEQAIVAGNNWLKKKGNTGPPDNPCLYKKFLETVLETKEKQNAKSKPKVDSGFAEKYAGIASTTVDR